MTRFPDACGRCGKSRTDNTPYAFNFENCSACRRAYVQLCERTAPGATYARSFVSQFAPSEGARP
jgi:hypothetical protein